ncbi:NUDIX domain-containing protein [Tepidimonas fonticaldi]|uniref:NUDIX domain-containing protein n=1 Tax=Tepidimonas fonticaldi TaxID=1101373 RepID=UPI0009ED7D4D|nr:NUDIX hydrolase [Tepidimonas fonticaldi]
MSDAALVPERHPAHLVEVCRETSTVWQGHFLSLCRDRVQLPDGREAGREYLRHPGAVLVVPMLADGRLVLERQYRYPVRRAMIEFPAGKRDAGEPSFVCAERELREETGYQAGEWARAGVLHPAIGYSDEVIEIWFARALCEGERRLDEGEFLDVLAVSPAALLQAVWRGEVTDGKTLAALLWWQNVTMGACPLEWRPAEAWRGAQAVEQERP